MNSQEKQGYIDEINYQKKMINNLVKWLRNLFFLSSLGVLLMYYFSNILFIKIFAIILIIISILAIILVGKAIYSGKKNINKIVDQFSLKYKNSLSHLNTGRSYAFPSLYKMQKESFHMLYYFRFFFINNKSLNSSKAISFPALFKRTTSNTSE